MFKNMILILISLAFFMNSSSGLSLYVDYPNIKKVCKNTEKVQNCKMSASRIAAETRRMSQELLFSIMDAMKIIKFLRPKSVKKKSSFNFNMEPAKQMPVNYISAINGKKFKKGMTLLNIGLFKKVSSFLKNYIRGFYLKRSSREIFFNKKNYRYLIGIGGYKRKGMHNITFYSIYNGKTTVAF